METLEEEVARLYKRLEQLNVNSPGRDRIIERLIVLHHTQNGQQTSAKAPCSEDSGRNEQIHQQA